MQRKVRGVRSISDAVTGVRVVLVSCVVAIAAGVPVAGQPSSEEGLAAPSPRITDKLAADASALVPLVSEGLPRRFLAATSNLVEPATRVVYRDRARAIAVSQPEYEAMSAEERAPLTKSEFPPPFYYETAYGSPLVYARLLDLAAPHLALEPRARILDFGFGSIGQLHLLAHCGLEAHGVDVEPVFRALYAEPGDTGAIGTGAVAIHIGQWPAGEALREAVGGGFALVTSKNTLKNGYLHPQPPAGQTVDPARLLHLGVGEEEFLRSVRDSLLPGGVFLIYNICPPQNPPDQEYLPWADGTCPFPRLMVENAGFEVLAFDADDQAWVLECFEALGIAGGKRQDSSAGEFFCWYTILRKPLAKRAP